MLCFFRIAPTVLEIFVKSNVRYTTPLIIMGKNINGCLIQVNTNERRVGRILSKRVQGTLKDGENVFVKNQMMLNVRDILFSGLHVGITI